LLVLADNLLGDVDACDELASMVRGRWVVEERRRRTFANRILLLLSVFVHVGEPRPAHVRGSGAAPGRIVASGGWLAYISISV